MLRRSVMDPFFEHLDGCKHCRPGHECAIGAELLKEGTQRLTRKMLGDPDRAKA